MHLNRRRSCVLKQSTDIFLTAKMQTFACSVPPAFSKTASSEPDNIEVELETENQSLIANSVHDGFLDSVSAMPGEYLWPENQRPYHGDVYEEPMPMHPLSADIPVIDMQQEYASLIPKLAHACQHWGFFYIINHGISMKLVQEMREKAAQLFALPLQTKIKARREEGSFEGFGKALISKFFKSLMWSEGFTVMGHPSSSIATMTSKLCAPGENEFRDVFEEYDIAMKGLAGKLLAAIIKGMGVEMEEFKCKHFDPESECNAALQLNYYPPCPQPRMTMGLAAHTDSTCITILEQGDSITGLQMYKHGHWIPTPPLPSSLIIHVGDMLQVLSNGKYESILHRAITNKENSRLSVAYLCGPPLNATISPCCKEMESMVNHPMYKPLTWKEYLEAKSEYFLNALDYFKYK